MTFSRFLTVTLCLGIFLPAWLVASNEPHAVVPTTSPRTMILAGQHDAFRAYVTTGEGAAAFAKLKADFDRDYLSAPFPAEPVTYGDPSPSKRTSEVADKWRDVQDLTGRISAIAEAATLCWIVTGEERYLAQAKTYLLSACRWHLNPDWKNGPVLGATDIDYNDEGHFRLWRKLPLVYDQLRDQLTADEKKLVLDHFRARGNKSVEWIERHGNISKITRNSIANDLSSHPVRFMPMTGVTALALWDDLPEARHWWDFAYRFYRDQFTPWGGDEGGWAEGVAYWRGTIEHAFFQDALLAIGDPLAYQSPFWKNSPYFAVYNVQPYLATQFGDLPNAGKFNLEPATAEYLLHLSRVQQDGFLRAFADSQTDPRPRPTAKGLGNLDRTYPTMAEFMVRNFTSSARPLPAARSLSELPPHRYFSDVGWVSLHSHLGQPDDDIHFTFVSSPYGSFSHSHAQQNAFILNAYGEGLAVKSGFREWHNSPHHNEWVRQTKSMNAILIDGEGQRPRSKASTGAITRFEQSARTTWTTGDATAAYATLQPKNRVQQVTRDIVFIDQRYFVIRDHVKLATPGKLTWLLHTERELLWAPKHNTGFTRNGAASLTFRLLAPYEWDATITEGFTVPVDPRYVSGEANYSTTGEWNLKQNHLFAESKTAHEEHLVFSVLWTDKNSEQPANLRVTRDGDTLTIGRPDGVTDVLTLTDRELNLTSPDRAADVVRSAASPSATIPALTADQSPTSSSSANTTVAEVAPVSFPGVDTFIYQETDREPLRLHVVRPKNWKPTDQRAALMFFFGGGWTKGTTNNSIGWAKFAASLGMVGIAPDYRTKNRFNTSPLEAVADARAALHWVQQHANQLGVNPHKIIVGGNSAGGHLALWTAIAQPPPGSAEFEVPLVKPAGLILMSTVSDTSQLSGYTPTRFGEHATPLSPFHQLDETMPPTIAFHGDADPTVPVSQALALRDKAIATGNRHELTIVPGGNHGFSSQFPEWREKSRAMIVEFLKTQKLIP